MYQHFLGIQVNIKTKGLQRDPGLCNSADKGIFVGSPTKASGTSLTFQGKEKY